MKSNGEYDWKFSVIGGVSRVNITSGEDIAHLDELDRKLWTVLSCPVKGLELDERSLAMVDREGDGVIRVDDVLAAARWLVSVLKDPECLMEGGNALPLSVLNQENGEGKVLHDTIRFMLEKMSLGGDSITLADVESFIEGFTENPFNGDGVITVASASEESQKKIIREIIDTVGGVKDLSGEDGVDAAKVGEFYAALQEFVSWKEAGDAAAEGVFPFGEDTAAALDATLAIKDKVDDYFIRCALAVFDAGSAPALDVSVDSIRAISGQDLTACRNQIASYPLSKVNPSGELNLRTGINPVWQATVTAFREKVAGKILPQADIMTEKQWKEILARFDAFVAWEGSANGAAVQSLGYERAGAILAEDGKESLLQLIARDSSLGESVAEFRKVEKLLHLFRDFIHLLNNFVTFKDFYSPYGDLKADFQAGTLYIDQRSCDLCIKVADMAVHTAMAPMSGMFLLYCQCVSRKNSVTMTIVAAVTDGETANLREGKNAIFYDRAGEVWDATVIKVVDNPISIREAFWAPYRRFADFIGKSINKVAADRESKVIDKGIGEIAKAGENLAAGSEAAKAGTPVPAQGGDADGKKPFDIARFAGLFAMVSMALTTVADFFLKVFKGVAGLDWWQVLIVFVGLLLLISGPSMFRTWLSLRKRNITPLLNANGWAINSKIIVNARFGATFTSLAKMPVIPIADDPFAGKKMSAWKKSLLWVLIFAALGVAAYFIFRHTDLNMSWLWFWK